MSIDPIHVGTGEIRIGGVDNTIVKELGTNIPKIPGTSLMGAARQYASFIYGKPEASGLHKTLKKDQKTDCPIIYTFGTANDNEGGQQGKVSISDAQILFFPVYSMAGPIWLTTVPIIDAFNSQNGVNITIDKSKINEDEKIYTSLNWSKRSLNLGWLHLECETGLEIKFYDSLDEWQTIKNRIAIVSPKIFSHVVNSNLEVRTSVAIDPFTGSAVEGALFTYEAIPKATWLWLDVIEDDFINTFPKTNKKHKRHENNDELLTKPWNKPIDVVTAGFELVEVLGMSGMSTRGFGRMRMIYGGENNDKS